MESLLGRLRQAGFSAEMTHHAYHALDSHILGFTMWEAGYRAGARALPDSGTFLSEFPFDTYPYLAEHFQEHVKQSKRGDAEGEEFEFGLDLILDGLQKTRVDLTADRRPAFTTSTHRAARLRSRQEERS
jgi:hypothetical protein